MAKIAQYVEEVKKNHSVILSAPNPEGSKSRLPVCLSVRAPLCLAVCDSDTRLSAGCTRGGAGSPSDTLEPGGPPHVLLPLSREPRRHRGFTAPA